MSFSNPKNIHIASYNYNLPDERIAKYPLSPRSDSKLLVWKNATMTDTCFNKIADYLPADSLMVFNNTRVIQARLPFEKETGAQIEIFCLEPYKPKDYLQSFGQTKTCTWLCLVGNSKKWKEGPLTRRVKLAEKEMELSATRIGRVGESSEILFSWNDQEVVFAQILDAVGQLPIPPYLNRETEELDLETYQTVYSKIMGSVAAPTAGLHFTPEVFVDIESKNIKLQEVTLHVGAGTFKPVQADEIGGHKMHSELLSVSRNFVESILAYDGKIVAVGTTSVRTLESIYFLGTLLERTNNIELTISQWLPYEKVSTLKRKEALQKVLNYMAEKDVDTLVAHTAIMIVPGYDFKMVDAIVTNFHQPKSTLLLLVSAFLKNNHWKELYEHALENDYRFLSYGDSSLLWRD